ncbi:hypothetical protein BRC87_01815 [Halobacteriales archaeon QS_4_66_20]|nr:MAG: hypothetical protein BRC87_01815 [Halobacteriales archaeon QS_4_66_20]
MRAQTTLDFAIGIAIFIAVLLFTFTFVPGILEPFEIQGEEEPALSDRVAETLAADQLGSPQTPNVLDRQCTVAFFNDSVDDFPCSFDNSESLRERLDLRAYHQVNVSIVNSTAGNAPYCWTSSSSTDEPHVANESACDSGDDFFEAGDDPSSAGTTITARRTVRIGAETATLRVVIW